MSPALLPLLLTIVVLILLCAALYSKVHLLEDQIKLLKDLREIAEEDRDKLWGRILGINIPPLISAEDPKAFAAHARSLLAWLRPDFHDAIVRDGFSEEAIEIASVAYMDGFMACLKEVHGETTREKMPATWPPEEAH